MGNGRKLDFYDRTFEERSIINMRRNCPQIIGVLAHVTVWCGLYVNTSMVFIHGLVCVRYARFEVKVSQCERNNKLELFLSLK